MCCAVRKYHTIRSIYCCLYISFIRLLANIFIFNKLFSPFARLPLPLLCPNYADPYTICCAHDFIIVFLILLWFESRSSASPSTIDHPPFHCLAHPTSLIKSILPKKILPAVWYRCIAANFNEIQPIKLHNCCSKP